MKNKNKTNTNQMITMLPPLLVLAVLPLIMKLYIYDHGLSAHAWILEDGQSTDLFLHGKMVFFEIMLAAMCIVFVLYLRENYKRMKFPPIFACLIGYMVLALLSTFFSPNRSFGFSGIHEQFENVWCLLGYAFVIIYMYYEVVERRQYELLIYALLISSLVIGVIGASQFLHVDLVLSKFAKMLYTFGAASDINLALTFGDGIVYLTLYNPDYVGLYTALVSPILVVVAWYNKKILVKITAIVSLMLMVLSTIGSTVAAAYIGLGVAFILFLVMLFRQVIGSRKILAGTVATIICFLLCVFGSFALQDYVNTRYAEKTMAETSNDTTTEPSMDQVNETSVSEEPESYKLERITETDEYVEFCYNGTVFRESLKIEDGYAYLDFTDAEGQPIDYDYDEISMLYTLTEEGLQGITATTAGLSDKYIGFITTIDGKRWAHALANKDGVVSYYYFNAMGQLDKNVHSESSIFSHHYAFLNGRGYIWAKTIPLLKQNILFGSGADTFVLEFPQNDYLDAYKGGYENRIISKPHCMYLQIAVQTGLLSLILLMLFYLWYAFKCMKLYLWKKELTYESMLAIAIFAGSAGVLVISLVNDSTICVMPMFAVILGLGIALNRINEEKETAGDS